MHQRHVSAGSQLQHATATTRQESPHPPQYTHIVSSGQRQAPSETMYCTRVRPWHRVASTVKATLCTHTHTHSSRYRLPPSIRIFIPLTSPHRPLPSVLASATLTLAPSARLDPCSLLVKFHRHLRPPAHLSSTADTHGVVAPTHVVSWVRSSLRPVGYRHKFTRSERG